MDDNEGIKNDEGINQDNEGINYLREQIQIHLESAPNMRDALLNLIIGGNIPFAWENLYRWVIADEATRGDIAMFFEPMSDSELTPVEYIGQLARRDSDGTPTSIDLNHQTESKCCECGSLNHTCNDCEAFVGTPDHCGSSECESDLGCSCSCAECNLMKELAAKSPVDDHIPERFVELPPAPEKHETPDELRARADWPSAASCTRCGKETLLTGAGGLPLCSSCS